MDTFTDLLTKRAPTARRPLFGLTILAVEDSHVASEALRLLCLHSGARLRRAGSIEQGQRHLVTYRPSVLIVDVGLPDGSGADLIENLAQTTPRIDVILGTSGDPDMQDMVIKAGADGFLSKPIPNIGLFQEAILRHLPKDRQPPSPRGVNDQKISPDIIAYHDDLHHAAQVLKEGDIDYATQFLSGVAHSVQDNDIHKAVTTLTSLQSQGAPLQDSVSHLSELVQSRLAAGGVV